MNRFQLTTCSMSSWVKLFLTVLLLLDVSFICSVAPSRVKNVEYLSSTSPKPKQKTCNEHCVEKQTKTYEPVFGICLKPPSQSGVKEDKKCRRRGEKCICLWPK